MEPSTSSWILYKTSGTSHDRAADLGIGGNATYHFILPEDQIQPCCEETMVAVTTIIQYVNDKHFLNSFQGTAALWSDAA
ncbi:carboxypeptidase O-like [Mobula hypostoma]|uniref:carboxypeptidase O-like n=1 Tax=Mobula hypostoma TaxID=723540 RepID=UPI002FC34941